MTAIAFVSSAWGPRFGGINAFNTELCRAVGRTRPDLKVYCFAFGITEADIRGALADGVELIAIGDDPGDRPLDDTVGYALVELARDIADVRWWVGHDVISGRAAIVAGERSGRPVALFQHTDYASYGPLKGTSGDTVLRRDQRESDILSRAKVLLGVGPKLAAAAHDRVRSGSISSQVTMLVPGLPELQPSPSPPNTFRAITFGRLDADSDRIKQGRLAVRSFGELIRQVPDMVGADPRITVVGLDRDRLADQQDELAELAGRAAHRAVTVVGHPFTEDRDILFRALTTSSVSLMLSVHEGFGLTGWEAIAAEVPLVLSKNSGLFELLADIGGNALGCVTVVDIRGQTRPPYYTKKDIKTVTKALRKIAFSAEKAKQNARSLKAILSRYDWSTAAGTLLDAMDLAPMRSVTRTTKNMETADSIPPPLTDDLFVGRGAELDRLVGSIRDGGGRLSTVTGPPGAGKTRFVTEVARALRGDFAGRIYYVDLVDVAEPELVAASIITALRVRPHDPILEALKDFFRADRSLLILDNFEHLISAALALRELVSGAPPLHVLVASRELLRVTGEREIALHEISPADAAALFRERRSHGGSDLATGDRSEIDDELIGEICRSLDFLPLAIEIVAARSDLYSLRQLPELIRDSVLDLASTRQDVPEKQRSLRAAIDWSYSWLSEEEQDLFRRLSVFADGWTLRSASGVLGGTAVAGAQLEFTMGGLLHKSLIRRRPHGRLGMLDTLRSYARERLGAGEDARRLHERHAEHFLALLDGAIPEPAGRAELPDADELRLDAENFDKALQWFLRHGRTQDALHMCVLLGRFWWSGDLLRGRQRMIEVLTEAASVMDNRDGALALLWRARLDLRLGHLVDAERGFRRAVQVASGPGDDPLAAIAQGDLALVHIERGDYDLARPLLESAREQFEGAGDVSGCADVIDSLGTIDAAQGDHQAASEKYEQSWLLYERAQDRVGMAWVANDQAALALAQDQFEVAIERAEWALAQAHGDRILECWANQRLAAAFCGRGLGEPAREHAGRAARLARLLGDQRLTLLSMECFVRLLLLDQGDHKRAITLAEAVDQARARLMIPRTRTEANGLEPELERAEHALDPGAVAAAKRRGRSLDIEQALAFAEPPRR